MFYSAEIRAVHLFEHFKELEGKIPYLQLAKLPTPIEECFRLEKALHHGAIFIKRDDLTGSGDLYGGNKVRKLEFLMADAVQKGAKEIVTFGCVGTNHGLATACYAKKLGFRCTLMLKHQPNSPVVRQNLLLDHYFNADIRLFSNNKERQIALDWLLATNGYMYFFPTGGSVPLGSLGFVNAAFELKKQVECGVMPEPDIIYMPIGSCGTTAGLLLGLQLAHMHSKIIAIAVEPEEKPNQFLDTTQKLFMETNQLLASVSSDIPLLEFPHQQLIINKDFCGSEYGLWLPAGNDAAQLMCQEEGIILEGTYSAKALAALCADIKSSVVKRDEIVLLWNTYCGLDFSHLTKQVDYKQLNPSVHRYFQDIAS